MVVTNIYDYVVGQREGIALPTQNPTCLATYFPYMQRDLMRINTSKKGLDHIEEWAIAFYHRGLMNGLVGVAPLTPSHLPVHLALRVLALQILALIVQLLAAGKANINLCQTLPIDKKFKGNDGKPLFLGTAEKLLKLLAGEKELPLPLGFVIIVCTIAILGNMHTREPELVVYEAAVGINKGNLALADGLYLGSC